jgi:hypothetical protein
MRGMPFRLLLNLTTVALLISGIVLIEVGKAHSSEAITWAGMVLIVAVIFAGNVQRPRQNFPRWPQDLAG